MTARQLRREAGSRRQSFFPLVVLSALHNTNDSLHHYTILAAGPHYSLANTPGALHTPHY